MYHAYTYDHDNDACATDDEHAHYIGSDVTPQTLRHLVHGGSIFRFVKRDGGWYAVHTH